MQFLPFQLADFATGAAIPLGKCFVYLTGTATLAQLYDAGGSPIANPAIASSLAQVGFAAADGVYDLQPAYADGTPAGPKILSQRLFDTTQAARVLYEAPTIPQRYYQATDAHFGFCVQRALDDLRTNHSFNPSSGGGFYVGSGELKIPAGNYDMGGVPVDVSHTLKISGEGSGQFGPGGGGSTCLKWDGTSSGLRIQAANTSGDTTVDGATHAGSGGVVIQDLCLDLGFTGTEGEHHALNVRNAIKAYRLYLKNAPGEGVKAWAGTVSGFGSVSGNTSTMLLEGVKTENCRGGIDPRGADANIITTVNCEGYNNRLFGLCDGAGAGANVHLGLHCATNGAITGAWPQTQCSYSGNRYALKNGGDPTVAPSGTTTDTPNWLYMQAGGAVVNTIPAWVSTPGTFRFGGDMITLNTAAAQFINPYSEGGGFSQFNGSTQVAGGTLSPQYFRGGCQFTSNGSDGMAMKVHGPAHLTLDFDGSEAGFQMRNLSDATVLAFLSFVRGDTWWLTNGLNIHTGALRIAETTVLSGQMAAIANLSAAPTQADFNNLLAELRGVNLLHT